MNNYLNIDTIRQMLNRSAGQLHPQTLAGLRAAREQALLRHAPEMTSHHWLNARRRRMATAFATVLVAVSLFGGVAYYWQQQDSDVDMAILTDEMPVDVYAN
jgi:hypothetical protein